MEVRNNTPSFGMALRKPQDMERFTKYIVSAGPEALAKRGLARVVKKQANNAHFDIEYRPHQGVAVVPKSEEAVKHGYGDVLYTKKDVCNDLRGRYVEKYCGDAYKDAYESASKSKKVLMTTRKVLAFVRVLGNSLVHPEEALPKAMRAASKGATASEISLKSKIAEEAAASAKKQKLEAEIESIFEPKISKTK